MYVGRESETHQLIGVEDGLADGCEMNGRHGDFEVPSLNR